MYPISCKYTSMLVMKSFRELHRHVYGYILLMFLFFLFEAHLLSTDIPTFCL